MSLMTVSVGQEPKISSKKKFSNGYLCGHPASAPPTPGKKKNSVLARISRAVIHEKLWSEKFRADFSFAGWAP